jgi:hypothetical protein
MAKSNLLSGRVKPVNPKNVSSDRYQFLDLSNAEPNLGVPNFSASLSGSPAIVVSDDQGNRGFVRSLDLDRVSGQFTGSFTGSAELSGSFTGSFTGSFSGSYFGDGSGLYNLPVAPSIASGSFTASFTSGGLNINTNTNVEGNLSITSDVVVGGNLYVSKSIYADQLVVNIISSSVIYSSGSNIFGDEASDVQQFTGSVEVRDRLYSNEITGSKITGALTGSFIGQAEATGSFTGSFSGSFSGDGSGLINLPEVIKLASGSVTASVSPDGFVIKSLESGSIFSGSIFMASGSFISGSGILLFDIPE